MSTSISMDIILSQLLNNNIFETISISKDSYFPNDIISHINIFLLFNCSDTP